MNRGRTAYRRLIGAAEAADVVGCDSVDTFLTEVEAGVWPRPLPLAELTRRPRKRRVWDVDALHHRIDELSGLGRRLPVEDLDGEFGVGNR